MVSVRGYEKLNKLATCPLNYYRTPGPLDQDSLLVSQQLKCCRILFLTYYSRFFKYHQRQDFITHHYDHDLAFINQQVVVAVTITGRITS